MNRRSLSIIALLIVVFAASAAWGKQRAPVAQFNICNGDGACDAGESHYACPEDCPDNYCGDGYCDNYEVQQGGQYSCPQDCEVCPNGGTWPECQECPYGQYGDWPNCSCENGGDPGNGCQLEEDPCADPNNPGCGYCGDNRCDESEQGGENKCNCSEDCGEPQGEEKIKCNCQPLTQEEQQAGVKLCDPDADEKNGCMSSCRYAACSNEVNDDKDYDRTIYDKEDPTDTKDPACHVCPTCLAYGIDAFPSRLKNSETDGDQFHNPGTNAFVGTSDTINRSNFSAFSPPQQPWYARLFHNFLAQTAPRYSLFQMKRASCVAYGNFIPAVLNVTPETASVMCYCYSNRQPDFSDTKVNCTQGIPEMPAGEYETPAFVAQLNTISEDKLANLHCDAMVKIENKCNQGNKPAFPLPIPPQDNYSARAAYCGDKCRDWLANTVFSGTGPREALLEWCQASCFCGMNGAATAENKVVDDMNKKIKERWDAMVKQCKDEQAAALKADPDARYDCTKQAWFKSFEAIKQEEQKNADPIKKKEIEKAFDSDQNSGDQCYGQCMRGELGDNVCYSGDPSCCRAHCVTTKCPVTRQSTPPPTGGRLPSPTGGSGGGGGTIAGGSGGGGGTAGTGGGVSSTPGGSTTGGATGGGGGGGPGGASGGGGGGSSVSSRASSNISSSRLSSAGFSSSRFSSVSTRSSAFSTSTSRSSIPLFQRSSSRSSRRSSFGAYSSYLQVLACPPDACALNNYAGNTFCAQQGMACVSSNDLPCIRCVAGDFSSSSFGDIPFSASSAFAVSSRPLQCGNGIIDAGEECDDGNLSNADSCTTACRRVATSSVAALSSSSKDLFALRFCGNGSLNEAEECDLGSDNSDQPNASCRTDCSLSRCGDQIVDGIRGEQCDDGNATDGDGCSASCAIEQFAGNPSSAAVLPGSLIELPFVPGTPSQASVLPNVPAHGPVGDTGPETVAIMAAGASAGYTWMKMRRTKK